MVSAFAALLIAFCTTLLVTPIVRDVAKRAGVVDAPGGRRVHVVVTPRLGGVAVMAGFFLPLGLFAVVRTTAMLGFLGHRNLVVGLVLGSLIVGVVGAVDDIRTLGPWPKLAAQAVAAVVAYWFGYRIEAVNLPMVGDLEMGVLSLPVTVFWFLGITNALNLIDGLDGLAAGIALFATVSNAAIAYVNGSEVVVLLSAGLAGALVGFLRYNFNPATIFLGDAGSMFLGFVLAATSLAGAMTKSSTAVAIIAPILALGLPILDTLLAMVRRTLAHQSIFAADRRHIHHRLLDLGLTHRRVVLALYCLSLTMALGAVAIAAGRSWHVGITLASVFVLAVAILRLLVRPKSVDDSVGAVATGAFASRDEAHALLCAQCSRAVAVLAGAENESEIVRCIKLVADEPHSALRLSLESQPQPSVSERADGSLSYSVGSSDRPWSLTVELPALVEMTAPDVVVSLSTLVDACTAALRRSASAASRSRRLQTQVAGGGAE